MNLLSENEESVASQASERRLRQVCICASPKAGSGQGREQIQSLVRLLKKMDVQCSVTSSLKQLAEVTAKLPTDVEGRCEAAVVAAGGDGTVSVVAAATPPGTPIVVMPLGTENLIARHLGYKVQAEQVAETLRRGRDWQMDAGLATPLDAAGSPRKAGRLFLVMASAGFDAEVVRSLHLKRRGHIRRWSYVKPIIRAVRRYVFWPLQASDNAETSSLAHPNCGWVMAFNLPCYGFGFRIAPEAIGDDGLLDQVRLPGRSLASGIWYAAQAKFGGGLPECNEVRSRSASVDWTSTGRVPYQLDGDYAGRLPVRIECVPGRVTFRTSAS